MSDTTVVVWLCGSLTTIVAVVPDTLLKMLLADVLDRSDDVEARRKDDLDRVRRERIAAEARCAACWS